MNLRLSRQQRQQLLDWAAEAHPQECCGLLLAAADGVELQLANNVASDPLRHFEIDPSALIAAEKAERDGALQIIGYFHSHPNGLARPSETDADMAIADGRIWLIISDEEITGWQKSISTGFVDVALMIDG